MKAVLQNKQAKHMFGGTKKEKTITTTRTEREKERKKQKCCNYIYIYIVISEELNKDWLNLIFFLFFF
jgi:hypothetical protein